MPRGAVDTHAHVIGLPPDYPFMPERSYTPPEATAQSYIAMLDATGMTYGVLMAHGRSFVPDHLLGRGITLLNVLFIGGAGVLQPLSGGLMKGIAMGLGYQQSAQLGSVANNGPLEGAHITASGLSFGVNWRLDGTTY